MAEGTIERSTGGEVARVMRSVTWFLILPLLLPLAGKLRGQHLTDHLDALETTAWVVAAAAFYLGFRGRRRDPKTYLTIMPYALLAFVAVVRVGATPQVLAVVPFFVAAVAVMASAAQPAQAATDEVAASAGHPLDTVAMLERHAEDLESEGKKTAAAKLRGRIDRLRNKHDVPG